MKNLFNNKSFGKACAIGVLVIGTALNVANIWQGATNPDSKLHAAGGIALSVGGLAGWCVIKRRENQEKNGPKPE